MAAVSEQTTTFALEEKGKLIKSLRRFDMVFFTICALVGLDTLGSICDVLFDEFRERRFARPQTIPSHQGWPPIPRPHSLFAWTIDSSVLYFSPFRSWHQPTLFTFAI